MPKEFIAVVGATASGKSAVAMSLAQKLDGEIVSFDSMQIYRGMDVGTAKPTKEDRALVRHHLIDIVSPDEDYSAGDFCVAAKRAIDDITARKKCPILCGGTFLYLDSLTSSYTENDSERDDTLREELARFAAVNGNAALHGMLRDIDPTAADSIHENNVKRVIRAIEIFKTSGRTKTEWDTLSKEMTPPYDAHIGAIGYRDRTVLYDRIDRRVDEMMRAGLATEAERLFKAGLFEKGKCAAQAIGYKEFAPYFAKEATLDETCDMIKQSTRNYAKRQLTWLKRYKDAVTVFPDENAPNLLSPDEIADRIIEGFAERGIRLGGKQ